MSARSTTRLWLLIALLISDGTWSFTIPASSAVQTSKQSSSSAILLQAQKSICTFDEEDFALATGEWPYTEADMRRLDSSDDFAFYANPRFVTHIDDRAIESLTSFYREELAAVAKRKKKNEKVDVLDLCSSWISHLPDVKEVPFGRIVGVGMNEAELSANGQLTEYYVQDMNEEPSLSRFEDNSFDAICNVVSVDYLTQPREIFQEMHRILRPGGVALMSFSNRCFATKAVNMWLQADDIGRMTIVASYFHYTAKWASIEALDIVPAKLDAPVRPEMADIFASPAKAWAWMSTAAAVNKANAGDPMYVVKAEK
jgi:ubiquinone/menaquinone biosynthesis C-methylase UbiE